MLMTFKCSYYFCYPHSFPSHNNQHSSKITPGFAIDLKYLLLKREWLSHFDSACTVSYNQQRVFSLQSAVFMLYGQPVSAPCCMNAAGIRNQHRDTHLLSCISHSLSVGWKQLFGFCVDYTYFAFDLILFGFLFASVSKRTPAFWEGKACTFLLYYLWYQRRLLGSG